MPRGMDSTFVMYAKLILHRLLIHEESTQVAECTCVNLGSSRISVWLSRSCHMRGTISDTTNELRISFSKAPATCFAWHQNPE